MKRTALIYTGFTSIVLIEAVIFITTTSYYQLAFAILLYFPLVYFALKLFPRSISIINSSPHSSILEDEVEVTQTTIKDKETERVEIADIDKRAFLKVIGATGLAFFIFSIFGKRVNGLFPGKPEASGVTTLQDSKGEVINPAILQPTDNYKISEVDYGLNNYYGFIDQSEGWYIMKQEMNTGAFRYIKGDKNFGDNWNNRENLKYDFYNRVFPTS